MNRAFSTSWHLCKCLISFEWITVRLSGSGPKPYTRLCGFGDSPLWVACDKTAAASLTKSEGGPGVEGCISLCTFQNIVLFNQTVLCLIQRKL